MIIVFEAQIPQHLSMVEQWIEDDYDHEEDDVAEHNDRTIEQPVKEVATASYSVVLGVKVDYADSKAIAGMEVVEVFGSYLPDNVLGMTDCTSKIWIRYGLGYLKKHVLMHEIEHVKDPAASEYIIRLRAKQREPTHYIL
ncbi:MAG: hypothetical protein HY051_02680 [Candidatus Aenigmarchaeota archaeon]|nr:hypothetical protein [Candidatus Aenigmarchaeota archaeon]